VVDKAGDRVDAKLANVPEALVMPRPVILVRVPRRDGLPQSRIAESPYAKVRDPLQILQSAEVSRILQLVAKGVANPDDAALDSTPEIESSIVCHTWTSRRSNKQQ
jgi:hypothetical protein